MNATMHPTIARALAPMAPPQSEVHRIVSEAELIAADRARDINKAERLADAEAERALDLQVRWDGAMGAWA